VSQTPFASGASALTRAALSADIERRVSAAQAMMREHDVKAVVAVVAGVPGRTGWLRYFAGAHAPAGRAFVVIEPAARDPLVVVATDEALEWIAASATTQRIENTSSAGVAPLDRVIEIIGDLTGGRGRLGTLSVNDFLSFGEHRALTAAFPALTFVDLTDAANQIRQIKSPFEIEAMKEMGRTLTEALDLFAQLARPGRSMVEVAAEIEGFLKGRGCLTGRIKYSLGERPYTIPPVPGQRFSPADIFVFQFVYLSRLGYWYELSRLYSFRSLPEATTRRLRAMEHAMVEGAALAVPGSTYGMISAASDRIFSDHGFDVIGKHTEDCHTIGTDIQDGLPITPEGWELRDGAVLAMHPASLLDGDLGFFLIDHVLVREHGGVRLAPANPFYQQLDS
jgi:Xaa-Pro aminopeptidase